MNYGHFSRTRQRDFNIYAKIALKMQDLDTITLSKHDKIVKKVKKVVSTRWLSLHASVDGVSNECVG